MELLSIRKKQYINKTYYTASSTAGLSSSISILSFCLRNTDIGTHRHLQVSDINSCTTHVRRTCSVGL